MEEAKKYLQEKHEWHRKHWNEHDYIDDNWWANEMQSYADEQVKKEKKLQGIIYKEMLRRKLDEIEKSLMSESEIFNHTPKLGRDEIRSLLMQRNKTQEVINELREKL